MDPTYSSVTTDDITVESNTESAEAMRANFGVAAPAVEDPPVAESDPDPTPDLPIAATDEKVEATTTDATRERNPDGTFKVAAKPRNRRDDPTAAVQAAIAKQREAERRADLAEQRARDLETRATATPPEKAPEKPPTQAEWQRYKAMPAAPKVEQFETYEDYGAALALFIADTRYDERAAKDRETKATETRAATWQDRLAKARAKMPDFDQRLKIDTPMSATLQELVTDSDLGPELLLYFSDHPQDAQRLSTLHPIQLIRELGRLEERVTVAASDPKTGPAPTLPTSQAKPPIQPVAASPQITDADEGADDEPIEKHFARENARDRKAGRR